MCTKSTKKDRNKTVSGPISNKSNAIETIIIININIHYLLNKIFKSNIIIESENHMHYAHVDIRIVFLLYLLCVGASIQNKINYCHLVFKVYFITFGFF